MSAEGCTPHAEVNGILETLLESVKDTLDDQFIGMYLSGSLANGGFDRHSDIDVVVVTQAEITEPAFSSLAEMHQRIAKADSPWAMQLEVSYIPKTTLRRFNPADNSHPHIDRGKREVLHLMDHESDWIIQRHVLRERGITVEGPAIQTLVDPVSQDELRQAVADVMPFWVTPILEDPLQQLKNRGYQSFIVLSLCRMLYTVQHGAVISKYTAAEWAKKKLSHVWTPLLERAIIGRQNPDLSAEPEDIRATLKFVEYIQTAILEFRKTVSAPTPYPQVNEVLHLLLSRVKEALDSQFVGMYLYGSLSSGDFDPESSDIDFIVGTTEMLSDEAVSRLEAMHEEIWSSGLKWAAKLEGSYVPVALLQRYEGNGPACPTVNEGRFFIHTRGSDWIIQLHVIRECGVVVEGPDPKSLIDPVSPADIRQAVEDSLNGWWFSLLKNPAWLMERGSAHHAFTVITMCRALHALEYGVIVSKPVAARWAQAKYGIPWNLLIEKALVTQHGSHDGFPDEALDFIRFTQSELLKMRSR